MRGLSEREKTIDPAVFWIPHWTGSSRRTNVYDTRVRLTRTIRGLSPLILSQPPVYLIFSPQEPDNAPLLADMSMMFKNTA